jgi:hypothetical protein
VDYQLSIQRQYQVRPSQIPSSTFEMLFGVPQGSVLGPVLFCVFISALYNATDYSRTLHSADNINIHLSIKSATI